MKLHYSQTGVYSARSSPDVLVLYEITLFSNLKFENFYDYQSH